MKIMVVGGGGREHAIIKSLKKNSSVEKIYALPGNGGISADAECYPIKANDIDAFFSGILASGRSSFCYLQNVYTTKNVEEQGLSLAICLADGFLSGKKAAFRVHGGGFAGTIQAFVPSEDVEGFKALMDSAFGEGACLVLRVRRNGAVKVF